MDAGREWAKAPRREEDPPELGGPTRKAKESLGVRLAPPGKPTLAEVRGPEVPQLPLNWKPGPGC